MAECRRTEERCYCGKRTKVLDLAGRLGACFEDHRDPTRTEHSVEALVRQGVLGLTLGYDDLNDHDEVRRDSMLALACGRDDLTGEARARARDRAYPLAGSSTLNRMELGSPETAKDHRYKKKDHRYKKIVADQDKMDALLVDALLDMHREPRQEIVIDLDATDDPVHGKQEGAQYHGYYHHYCLLPLYITCGDPVLGVRVRPSRIDASKGALRRVGVGGRADPGSAGRRWRSRFAAIRVSAVTSSWHGARSTGPAMCSGWRAVRGSSG